MTKYIRGWCQLRAIFILIEQVWLILIGRDTRGLDEWDMKHCAYSGRLFIYSKLQCAKRELEIFFGFAKPYAIRTTQLFNQQYAEMFGKTALVELLYRLEKANEENA